MTSDSIAAKSVRASFGCPTNVLDGSFGRSFTRNNYAVPDPSNSADFEPGEVSKWTYFRSEVDSLSTTFARLNGHAYASENRHPTQECTGRHTRDLARDGFEMAFEQCEIRARFKAHETTT
jgi:hypothetical protein